MQPWQIKTLKLEVSALDALTGFMRDHALWFFIGAIYLLLALLVWVLSGALRRKGEKPMPHIRPVMVVHIPIGQSPPPPEPFDPPYWEPPPCDCDWDDRYPD
jgi:hypothetical protein